MSALEKNLVRAGRIAVTLVPIVALNAYAEMGIGYIGSDFDPHAREFRAVYKDWQEGVVQDPKTQDYTVTYKQGGNFYEVTYSPRTKIDPTIRSNMHFVIRKNSVSYEYELKSGAGSRQNIHAWRTEISSIKADSLADAEGWRGAAVPNFQRGLPVRLNWTYRGTGLAPGHSAKGFHLESDDLPGVVIARIEGDAPTTVWLGSAPEIGTPVGDRVAELEEGNFVPRLAAIPRISVPTPYDAAVVLTNIQSHLDTDLVRMGLVDPTLVTELDRWLSAAISAAKSGNDKALRADVQEARRLLRHEHTDLDKDDDRDGDDDKGKKPKPRIDRLAARVLDFDLRYVEQRLKSRDD